MMKIAIVGGGAAGFFCAINTKLKNPNYEVTIYEKTNKTLTKVKVSGGGRCNVTNAEPSQKVFTQSYPRGENYLKKIYQIFKNDSVITWFEQNGVPLKAEADGRMFPKSDDANSIIQCFWKLCDRLGIPVILNVKCTALYKVDSGIEVELNSSQRILHDKVVLCTGGGNHLAHYDAISKLGHTILSPIPSLFTFNLVDKRLTALMGIVAKNAYVKILNTPFDNQGDLLITHWGLSGPAVIKLSAFAAQRLHELNYRYEVKVNWVNIKNEDLVREKLSDFRKLYPQKFVFKNPLFELSQRLWTYLCTEAEIGDTLKWAELSTKNFNKLVDLLTNSIFKCQGKTTFKEEFVTCGGVDLAEITPHTLQSKLVEGLYFAGEVVDIDGITGGYNFQNAWTTAYIVAQAL